MTTLQALVLGILEGLTEFLPVSSTGHLTLASHFLGIVQSDQFIVFEIAIQLGAIMAVLFFYWKRFFNIELLIKLAIAFIPTGIIGITVYKYIKQLLTNELIVVFTLIFGGIVLILIENWYKTEKVQLHVKSSKEISYKQALILGLAQSIAIIPGVSRSGATIVSGLLMKIERSLLVEFTFLLAVPTMTAATLYSLHKNKELLSTNDLGNIALGFIASFIVACFVIKYFLNYIKKYDFIPFGIYRIVLGLIVLLTIIM